MARHSTESCPTCGSKLDALQSARLERCKECGRRNPAGFSFCGHCGSTMATLNDEQDPFDAMLEEVISSMEPKSASPDPLIPDLLPEVHSIPFMVETPKEPAAAKPAAKLGAVAKLIAEPPPAATPEPKAVQPPPAPKPEPKKKARSCKPPTTKKLATSTPKRKSKATSKPALPALGFQRPAAPPVSGQHGSVPKKGSTVAAPAKVRRSSTMPSVPQEALQRVSARPLPAQTGHTMAVPALQPPRPFPAAHSPNGAAHSHNRIPTSKLAAARRSITEVPETPEEPTPQPRRRRQVSFGDGVLSRYKR